MFSRTGVLANGHVRCPWHGACFNIRTGDIEDFPGLDSVQKFEVSPLTSDMVLSQKPPYNLIVQCFPALQPLCLISPWLTNAY